MNDDDSKAYREHPNLVHLFNKLWLAENLNYHCGPGGVGPETPGWFVSRPIMNLRGMGIGAEKIWMDKDELCKVPPGHFWCEWFEGPHCSVSYAVNGGVVVQTSCYQGFNSPTDLSTFTSWKKIERDNFEIPSFLYNDLVKVPSFNVEFIGDKIIEVHLRDSPDPQYNFLIPLWEKNEEVVDILQKNGYTYINAPDDADGFLLKPRIGFFVK